MVRGFNSAESAAKGLNVRTVALGSAIGNLAATGIQSLTTGLIQAGKAGLQAAADFQQTQIAFTTMLGSAQKSEQFLADMRDFAAATPFELPGLLASARQLLAMGFAAKDVKPMLTSIGDAVAGLGLGDEGLSRITRALGQMNAKGKVSSEELRQLAEAGVPALKYLADGFGKTTAEMQKMVESGIVPADKGIQLLLAGMKGDFGGLMDKQSKTLTGVLSTFRDTARNALIDGILPALQPMTDALQALIPAVSALATGFGNSLGPALTEIATTAAPMIVDAFKQLGPALGEIISGVGKLLATGLGAFLATIGPIAAALAPVFNQLATVLSQQLVKIMEQIGPMLPDLAKAFADLAVALMPLIPLVVELLLAFTPLIPIFTDIVTGLTPVVSAFVDFVTNTDGVKTALVLLIGGFVGWTKVMKPAVGGLKTVIATTKAAKSFLSAYVATLRGQAIVATNAYGVAGQTAAAKINAFIAAVKAKTLALWSSIKAFVAAAAARVTDTAKLIAHTAATVASTIAQKAAALASKAWAAAQWLLNAALNANPIGLAIAAIAALVAGFVLAYKKVGWFRDAVNWLWDVIKTVFKAIWEIVSRYIGGWIAIFRTVVNGIRAFVSRVGDVVSRIYHAIADPIINLGERAFEWGRNIVTGLWDGIRSLIGSFTDNLSTFVEDHVAGTIAERLGISSPSKVTYEQGKMVGQGLADGINASKNVVSTASSGMAANAAKSLDGKKIGAKAASSYTKVWKEANDAAAKKLAAYNAKKFAHDDKRAPDAGVMASVIAGGRQSYGASRGFNIAEDHAYHKAQKIEYHFHGDIKADTPAEAARQAALAARLKTNPANRMRGD